MEQDIFNENSLPSFITSIQNGFANMPLKFANLVLGNKKNLWRLTMEEGWYLPAYESRSITTDYLFKVLNNQVFRVKCTDIRTHIIEKVKWSKLDLVCYIDNRLKD